VPDGILPGTSFKAGAISDFNTSCLRSDTGDLCEGRMIELDISKVEFNRKHSAVMQKIFNIER
jgi:hypothetical protein